MTTFIDIETRGLNPYSDQSLTIQVRRNGEPTIWKAWEMPEPLMLARFLAYMDALPWGETIVGYNVLGFDLPFVATRLTLNHAMNERAYVQLYRRKWFDLYQYLGADFRSADFWLNRVGAKRNCRYTGKDVPALYGSGRYREIEEHALEDLELCELLYSKLSVVSGRRP